MSILLCNYPKPNGIPYGSPALRGHKPCYTIGATTSAPIRRQSSPPMQCSRTCLPRLRNLRQVQSALYELLTAIAR